MTQTEDVQTTAGHDEHPTTECTTPAPVEPPLLQMWYHEEDLGILQSINPFFLHLQRRLHVEARLLMYKKAPIAPKRFDNTEYFRERYQEDLTVYQQKKQTHEEEHQKALADALAGLQRTALFVPCISYAFLETFERDLAATPELAQALKQPHFQIMPLVLRPTETGTAFSARPLCTYAEGYERETAFKEHVALMERILCDALPMERRTTALDYLFCSPNTVQPVVASQQTTMDLVLQALQPVNQLVEQASTQIVEARQLALTERSEQQTVQDLAQQVEALRQQLAQPSSFWSRFRVKKS